MRRFAASVICLGVAATVGLHVPGAPHIVAAGAGPAPRLRSPILFEENVGQLAAGVAFAARNERGKVSFTTDGRLTIGGESIALIGGRRTQPRGVERVAAHINYFRGTDPQRWLTDVPVYAGVSLADVYPGIDWIWKSADGAMEYDFVVRPGTRPDTIHLGFPSGTALRLASGDLIVKQHGTQVVHRRPRAYQEIDGQRRDVDAAWRIAGSSARFTVGEYDARYPLVIDPVLAWSQYLDGLVGYIDATVDAVTLPDGSVIVTGGDGFTGSINDLVISRVAAGGALIYTTTIGGSSNETAPHVAADASGRVFLAGATTSVDFPVRNAAQASNGGGRDAYVVSLGPAGDVVFATYAGGEATDVFTAITVAPDGSVWATGGTYSNNFPSPGGFRTTLSPTPFIPGTTAPNIVVEHLSRDGQLMTASYVWGVSEYGEGEGTGIAVAADGTVYVTATMDAGPIPFPGRGTRVSIPVQYVARLNPSNGAKVWNRTLGWGVFSDVAVSADQLVWAAGALAKNSSVALPTATPDAYDTTCGSDGLCDGSGDGFLIALDSAGNKVYATFLGGSAGDGVAAMRMSAAGSLWLTGGTSSTDWPDAKSNVDLRDLFVMRFSPATRTVNYVARFGGSGDDSAVGIAPDAQDGAYLAGTTTSTDLPARRDAKTSNLDRFLAYFAPLANVMVLDRPVNGAVLPTSFDVAGWAIDDRSPTGSGFDAVHVWAFPTAPAGAPVFLGAATMGILRPDVAAAFGARFEPSGYKLATALLPVGEYVIGAYGHVAATNAFETVRTASITVADMTRISVDTPANGAAVPRAFVAAGWAIDAGTTLQGTGIDYLDVWISTDTSNGFVYGGHGTYGIERPDIAAIFGERFRFSGFNVPVNAPAGPVTIAIFPHRALQTTFGQPAVITVTSTGSAPR